MIIFGHEVSTYNHNSLKSTNYTFNQSKFDLALEFGKHDVRITETDSVERVTAVKRVWAINMVPSLFFEALSMGANVGEDYGLKMKFQQVPSEF